MKVVYCAHQFSPKENIGDVLSAKAIMKLYGDSGTGLCCLPNALGHSRNEEVIYGGGGMIRPYFAEREVFNDFHKRKMDKDFIICGVGLNRDQFVSDFSFDDICAIQEWLVQAKTVTVRDRGTKLFLENYLEFSRAKINPCPSYIALKLTKTVPIQRKFLLGIVPSFGHTATYHHYLAEIRTFTVNLVEEVGHDRVCIICHDKQDYTYALKLFQGTGVSVYCPQSFAQVKYCYMQCDQIVSVRGHGVIFAAACDKPCSIVTLNLKMNTLFEFHYGNDPLGVNFNAKSHLLFLAEKRLPMEIEILSGSELFY